VKVSHTPGSGYASDYFCPKVKDKKGKPKKIMGYIEWDSEKKPVPDWCPIRAGNGKTQEDIQASQRGNKKQKTGVAEDSSTQAAFQFVHQDK
jgi:hypothetical protein